MRLYTGNRPGGKRAAGLIKPNLNHPRNKACFDSGWLAQVPADHSKPETISPLFFIGRFDRAKPNRPPLAAQKKPTQLGRLINNIF
jgi:hypothetical protein